MTTATLPSQSQDVGQDAALMSHLLRRAGFGATPDELDRFMAMSYEDAVETLLDPPSEYAPPGRPHPALPRRPVRPAERRARRRRTGFTAW